MEQFKIIVLDDDPTGIQTVHGVCVYTNWSEESIRAGFEEENPMFFILTNSRGFTAEETRSVHQLIGRRIVKISKEQKVPFVLISGETLPCAAIIRWRRRHFVKPWRRRGLLWMERFCAPSSPRGDVIPSETSIMWQKGQGLFRPERRNLQRTVHLDIRVLT